MAVSSRVFTPHAYVLPAPRQYDLKSSPASVTLGEHLTISELIQLAVVTSLELQHHSVLVCVFRQYLASGDLIWQVLQSYPDYDVKYCNILPLMGGIMLD